MIDDWKDETSGDQEILNGSFQKWPVTVLDRPKPPG